MTIRESQMKAFEAHRTADFTGRLHRRLSGLTARAGIPFTDEALQDQLELGVARGLRFFQRENELARYCEIVLTELGGWTAADHPEPVLQILLPSAIEPGTKLRNFELWLSFQKGAIHG